MDVKLYVNEGGESLLWRKTRSTRPFQRETQSTTEKDVYKRTKRQEFTFGGSVTKCSRPPIFSVSTSVPKILEVLDDIGELEGSTLGSGTIIVIKRLVDLFDSLSCLLLLEHPRTVSIVRRLWGSSRVGSVTRSILRLTWGRTGPPPSRWHRFRLLTPGGVTGRICTRVVHTGLS